VYPCSIFIRSARARIARSLRRRGCDARRSQSAGADPGPFAMAKGRSRRHRREPDLGRSIPIVSWCAAKLDTSRAREYCEAAKVRLRRWRIRQRHRCDSLSGPWRKLFAWISVERGRDPRDYTLVSFAVQGGLHAVALPRALQIPRVLAPCFPGALSALGILISDIGEGHLAYRNARCGSPALRSTSGRSKQRRHRHVGIRQRGRQLVRPTSQVGWQCCAAWTFATLVRDSNGNVPTIPIRRRRFMTSIGNAMDIPILRDRSK